MLRKEVVSRRVRVKRDRASGDRHDLERRGVEQTREPPDEKREIALENILQELEQRVKRRTCQVLRREISNEHHGGWVERGVLVDAIH